MRPLSASCLGPFCKETLLATALQVRPQRPAWTPEWTIGESYRPHGPMFSGQTPLMLQLQGSSRSGTLTICLSSTTFLVVTWTLAHACVHPIAPSCAHTITQECCMHVCLNEEHNHPELLVCSLISGWLLIVQSPEGSQS